MFVLLGILLLTFLAMFVLAWGSKTDAQLAVAYAHDSSVNVPDDLKLHESSAEQDASTPSTTKHDIGSAHDDGEHKEDGRPEVV